MTEFLCFFCGCLVGGGVTWAWKEIQIRYFAKQLKEMIDGWEKRRRQNERHT